MNKIEYTLDYVAESRSARVQGVDPEHVAMLPVPKLKTGRYRVTFERVRAELPEGHEWDGSVIRRIGVKGYRNATYTVCRGCVVGTVDCDGVGAAGVHPGVIDALRAEGLLPKAGA